MGIKTLLTIDLANVANEDCRAICVWLYTYFYFLFFTPSILLLFSLSSYWTVLILDPFFCKTKISICIYYISIYMYICIYIHVNTEYILFAPEPNINSKVGEKDISTQCCYAGYIK